MYDETLLIAMWEIRYAGKADQCCVVPFWCQTCQNQSNLLFIFSNKTRYYICTSCCLVTAGFPQGPWKTTKGGCVLYYQSSWCFLVSFEIRTVRLYLNKALIHAQTHSLIPLLNPSIGWDKDTLTI